MADSLTEENINFDVEKAFKECKETLVGDNDIDLDSYIRTFKEVNNFFQLLGAVFGFVATDVKNKIEILEEFRKGSEGDNFVTLKKMVKYEEQAGLLRKSKYVSGCRTFLRLHRGLDFIRLFLKGVGDLQNNDKTTTVCQGAYNETLANHHPWLVRKGAIMAMYALPTKDEFLLKVCGSKEEVEKAISLLPQFLEVAKEAYERADKIYTEHGLHDLP